MRNLVWLLIFLIFISTMWACANMPAAILSFQERTYRLCAPDEVPNRDYVGKVCFRYCAEWKKWRTSTGVNCKRWVVDVLDLKKESDYLKLRNASFVLVNKARVE